MSIFFYFTELFLNAGELLPTKEYVVLTLLYKDSPQRQSALSLMSFL